MGAINVTEDNLEKYRRIVEVIKKIGHLLAVIGSMFADKTKRAIGIAKKQSRYARKNVQFFAPDLNKIRDGDEMVKSHDGSEWPTTYIDTKNPEEILDRIEEGTELILFDEVQFFPEDFYRIIIKILRLGIDVIICGITTDIYGEPFKTTLNILGYADEIQQEYAICTHENNDKTVCGARAIYNQKIDNDGNPIFPDNKIEVGESGYAARCPEHFVWPNGRKAITAAEKIIKEKNIEFAKFM